MSLSGSDNNDGSAAAPWRTIDKANQTLVAGDIVYIHAGTYDEGIRPTRSGASDSQRIVYQVAGDGDVILTGFQWSPSPGGLGIVALGSRDYVTVSGRAPNGNDHDRYLKLHLGVPAELYGNFTGSEGNVVENVVMRRADGVTDVGPDRGWAFADYWYEGHYETKYNVLRHCDIYGYADGSLYTEDTITLAHHAHHNVVDGCYIGESRHISLNQNSGMTHTNVFRNNTVENPEHTAASYYGLGESPFRQDHHLLENNRLRASGETTAPLGHDGAPLQFGAQESIVRYNLISEAGSTTLPNPSIGGIAIAAGDQATHVSDNRFYHNSIVYNQAYPISNRGFGTGEVEKGRNHFLNNFVYDHAYSDVVVEYWRSLFDGTDRYIRNVFGSPGSGRRQEVIDVGYGPVSVGAAGSLYRNPTDPEFSAWHGFANIHDDDVATHTFADYAGKDYSLKTGSPYIDAASPLTVVAGADDGSSLTLRVEDARMFFGECGEFPAWMGVTCDWIAVGSDPQNITTAATVQITGTNDDTNAIHLSRNITRRAGDYVWLWRDSDGTAVVKGTAPDIGALEFEDVGHPPQPACSDGVDNDGDALIDYPADPGCTSSADTDEFNETAPPTDTTAPVISSVRVTDITPTTAQVQWLTDEPTNGVVRYGTNRRHLSSSVTIREFTTEHHVPLHGLTSRTRYYYRIVATDAAGNTARSRVGRLRTTHAPQD